MDAGVDTVSGLAQLTARWRGVPERSGPLAPAGPLGALETRLAGVVVAALKEAFDRDSARLELERSQIEAERQRAERALRAELRRQAAERALGQLRLIAVMAIGAWALSAALSVWLPGCATAFRARCSAPAGCWRFAALGAAFAAWQRVSAWTAETVGVARASKRRRR